MPWFQVDDQLAFHRKAFAAGNPAMGLWVRAGSWSMLNLTDGFIPDDVVKSLGSVAQAKKLVEVLLWHRVSNGYKFHEWDQRQMSSAEIAERRQKRVDAGRKGGKASGTARGKPKGEANASLDVEQEVNEKRTPVPDPLVVTSGGDLTQVEPPEKCPRHVGQGWVPAGCGDCADAGRRHKAWKDGDFERRRARKAAAVQARLDCDDCDEKGWLLGEDRRPVEPAVKCKGHLVEEAESA